MIDFILSTVFISRGYIIEDILSCYCMWMTCFLQDINFLKMKVDKSFVMKDLGVAKQILGMRITRDRKNHKLMLSQGEYIEKVLQGFRMQNAKPVSTPLAIHFKLRICVQRHRKK